MIGDFLRAVGQLGDRRFLKVFALSVLLTGALLAAFLTAWGWLVALIPANGWTLFGMDLTALDWLAGAVAWAAGALAAVILMQPVAALFIGLFLEEIADAVEAKHYPDLPAARGLGFWEMLSDGLIFAGALILANLAALIVYAFSGPLAPFAFLAVNGWLLGRQYFELVAARRVGAAEARRLRRGRTGEVWGAGALMAAGLSIPVLNLAIPVLAVATFTHAYHRGTARAARAR